MCSVNYNDMYNLLCAIKTFLGNDSRSSTADMKAEITVRVMCMILYLQLQTVCKLSHTISLSAHHVCMLAVFSVSLSCKARSDNSILNGGGISISSAAVDASRLRID